MGYSTVVQNQTLIEAKFTQHAKDDTYDRILRMVKFLKDNRIAHFNIKASDGDFLSENDASFQFKAVNENFVFSFNNSFSKSQNWIGYVTEIGETSFKARIEDANTKIGTYEDAEFDISDIEHEDKKMLSIGSAFYWSVGKEYRNGTLSNQSILRFKRLPKINSADFDEAMDLANDLNDNLNWAIELTREFNDIEGHMGRF